VGSAGYVHGYATPEQERLVEQAEHWRHRLIRAGTRLEPGTRLLEVGCGVGAVLGVLGQEFPGVRLVGVDIEQKQLEFARGHLQRAGVEARLVEADALALPFPDQSFDHVWMMWFLEHVADPPAVLCEARRVLAPGGVCRHGFARRDFEMSTRASGPTGGRRMTWLFRRGTPPT
jgi:ubiquinone/menaquinone biosynthesis C-methylase UbiE